MGSRSEEEATNLLTMTARSFEICDEELLFLPFSILVHRVYTVYTIKPVRSDVE
jgi:hypothetical protein